jgi:hypothetical protein
MTKTPVALLAALAVSLSAGAALADDDDDSAPPAASSAGPPSSGVGYLVTGGIFTGIGGVNLLTAPICKTSVIRSDLQDTCLGASLIVAGVALAVGIPLLVVGAGKRADYNAWRRAHPVAAGLWLAPITGGGAFGWGVEL